MSNASPRTPSTVRREVRKHQNLLHRATGKIKKLVQERDDSRGQVLHSIRLSRNRLVVIETTTCMGRVRFSSSTRLPPAADLSHLPGVYVVPGKFKSAVDRPPDLEAWERLRDRTRKLQTRWRDRKDRRATGDRVSKTPRKCWRLHRPRS